MVVLDESSTGPAGDLESSKNTICKITEKDLIYQMISIIVPTLNEEKYLPKLLQSIKEQDFQGEVEVIVADAGSKDKTREIAEKFGCRVVGGGLPPVGRNRGAEIARGEILFFVDADIILPPQFFSKAVEEFKRRNLAVASFLFTPDDKRWSFRLIFWAYNFWVRIMEKITAHAYMGTVLIKRDIHRKIQGFDEDVKLAEDHLYARKARKNGRYGVMRSLKLCGSARRYKKDGAIITCAKYILAGFHNFFIGSIKSDIFKYRFNHYDN